MKQNHLQTDGPQRGPNHEWELVLVRNNTTYMLMAHRGQNHEWTLVLLRNNTAYMLMAHKEAKIMSGHQCC